MTDNVRHIVYLALGSNLGDRYSIMTEAIEKIRNMIGDVIRQSDYHETEPWGFESDNKFLNAAVCVSTSLTPYSLLLATQKIERMMGREEKTKAGEYHDRVIDIDILLYDDIRLSTYELTIPHPFMNERDFVMKPLMEIMP